jgi:hypothetical protein
MSSFAQTYPLWIAHNGDVFRILGWTVVPTGDAHPIVAMDGYGAVTLTGGGYTVYDDQRDAEAEAARQATQRTIEARA